MINFKITTFLMVALFILSSSCKRDKDIKFATGPEVGEQDTEGENPVDMLTYFIKSFKFERFEGDGIELNQALVKIENRFNEAWKFDDRILTIINSSGEHYNPKIVIVLANATIWQILEIISSQTSLSYRIDPDNFQIEFYDNTSIISYGSAEEVDDSQILPPLGPLPE